MKGQAKSEGPEANHTPIQYFLVPHTHWDREWYSTFEEYRYRLVKLLDCVLEELSSGGMPCFWPDGQMAMWIDYLEVRRDASPTISRLSREGKLPLGPWFIQLDEFLVDGELHVRNLLLGKSLANSLGRWCPFGYLPDQFGHTAQMPQILRGFGIEQALVWRGIGPEIDGPALLWEALDGSTVLTLYLPEGYSLGAALPEDPEDLEIRLQEIAQPLAPYYRGLPILIMAGSDHTAPTSGVSRAAAALTARGTTVRLGLPHHYIGLLERDKLPLVRGELRSPARAHLLNDVASTRLPMKQRHWLLERKLLRYAEPLAAFAAIGGYPYPSWFLQRACRLLLENGFHDTICGTGIDEVYLDAHQRHAHADQVLDQVLKEAQGYLSSMVDTGTLPGQGPVVLVFNPTLQCREELVSLSSSVPLGDSPIVVGPGGKPLPVQMTAGHYEQIFRFEFSPCRFRSILTLIRQREFQGLHLNSVQLTRPSSDLLEIQAIVGSRSEGELDIQSLKAQALMELDDPQLKHVHLHIWRSANWQALFRATVPPLGWCAFRVTHGLPLASSNRLKVSKRAVENEYYMVQVDRNGYLHVTDKATGQVYRKLLQFIDEGDAGDEYNYSPPTHDTPVTAPHIHLVPTRTVRTRPIEHGPVRGTLEIRAIYRLPEGLTPDRSRRSKRRVETEVITKVSLVAGVRRIELQTEFENRAKDHRLRVWFPTGIVHDKIEVATAFGTVTRPVERPSDPSWPETPSSDGPHAGYVLISKGNRGLLLMARSLPEYACRQGDDGVCLGLTLVRSVGWLSREDLTTRKGHAGPALPTPGAQVQGTISAEYALVIGKEEDLAHPHSLADPYLTPPVAWFSHTSGNLLPPTGSLVDIDPPWLAISCFKEAEDGRGWIMRIYNPEGSEATFRLRLQAPGLTATEYSMDEDRVVGAGEGQELSGTIGGFQIKTFRISRQPILP